jgi:hypothetical protein
VSQRNNLKPWIVSGVWALAITALMGVALIGVSWAFVDVYNNFYKATAFTWGETFASAFGGGIEYRPLLIIGVKLAHWLVGLRAWAYKILVLLQFAAVLAGLLWIFQPVTRQRAAAACIALACLAGLHTSRVLFMFAPLNAHSFGVLLLLVAIALALRGPVEGLAPSRVEGPRSQVNDWTFLPLTLVALLLLESGGLIVAVLLVLWRMKAPGASSRALTMTLVAAVVYTAVRFGLGVQTATSTYTETGLGFGDVSAPQLGEIFANAPWLLWIYNFVASLLTVAVSEPRAGRYRLIEAILHGRIPVWMYIHVITSVVTTGLVIYALKTARIASVRDRYIAAAGITMVILGSALGFLYTRDRIALSAGVGYAMLVYVGLVGVLERRGERGRPGVLVKACIAMIAAGWIVRTGEAYFQLRDVAWENYLEWTARYEELGGYTRSQTDVLMMLRNAAVAQPPDDPRRDSAWTYILFEREYERTPP